LWHFPCIVMLRLSYVGDAQIYVSRALLLTLLITAISAVTHHLIERPCREWKPTKPSIVFYMFGACLPFVWFWTTWLSGNGFNIHRYEPLDYPVELNGCHCKVNPNVEPLHRPNLTDINPSLPVCSHALGELLPQGYVSSRTTKQGTAKNATLFLLGDSHSGMLLHGLKMALRGISSESTTQFEIRHKGTVQPCGYLPSSLWGLPSPSLSADRTVRLCAMYVAAADLMLTSDLRRGDVVAVAHEYEPAKNEMVASTTTGEYRPVNESAYVSAYGNFMRNLAVRLRGAGAKLVLFGGFGKLHSADPTTASCFGLEAPCHRSTSAMQNLYAQWHASLRTLAHQHDNVFFQDFLPLMCGRSTCSAYIPNTNVIAYWDSHHLNYEGSYYLWPFFCATLRPFLLTALDIGGR